MEEHRMNRPNDGMGRSLSGIINEVINLVRGEIALARAEVGDKVGQMGSALVMAVLGTALIMAALVILLQALVYAIAETGLHAGWSAAIVGGVTVLIGFILLKSAQSKIKPENLTPRRTMQQLQQDREAIRESRA